MNPKAIPPHIISWKKGIVNVYWINAKQEVRHQDIVRKRGDP